MSYNKAGPQILFVSHGGGPLPLLGDPGHREMVCCLEDISGRIRPPKSIVVVSAHWEEAVPTITSGAEPALIYDYYGFSPESYEIQYPCRGLPSLANHLNTALNQAGIDNQLDPQRGYDHGLFVPLKMMFPDANIPCVQVSLVNSLDAAEHYALGAALGDALDADTLLIGSGFSFHNLKAFFSPPDVDVRGLNEGFEHWLINSCADKGLDENGRRERLLAWQDAPGARFCHPREEHLLPVHVCAGAAARACTSVFELEILGLKASMFLW